MEMTLINASPWIPLATGRISNMHLLQSATLFRTEWSNTRTQRCEHETQCRCDRVPFGEIVLSHIYTLYTLHNECWYVSCDIDHISLDSYEKYKSHINMRMRASRTWHGHRHRKCTQIKFVWNSKKEWPKKNEMYSSKVYWLYTCSSYIAAEML